VLTRRLTGDLDFYASEGTIDVSTTTRTDPTTSDAALYHACYQYSDVRNQVKALSTETRDALEETGRIRAETVDSAFQTAYRNTGPETPISALKVGALQDNPLACYPPSESPVDLLTIPTPDHSDDNWVDLTRATTRPLFKRAVIADLINEGVLDRTRHPSPAE